MLTLTQIKQRIQDAYDNGLLTAQAPLRDDRKCEYVHECSDGVTRFCAIGAAAGNLAGRIAAGAIYAGALESIEALEIFPALLSNYDFRTTAGDRLAELQDLHDVWCSAAPPDADYYDAARERARKEFVDALQRLDAE